MTTLETFRSTEDSRRQWRRVPVRFTVRCKRLGWGDDEMMVEAVNLSPGGARLRAPEQLTTGDVVMCWIDSGNGDFPAGVKALVVQAESHRADMCDVHVAWTNLSVESEQQLKRLLVQHDSEGPGAPNQARLSQKLGYGEPDA